jgi:hypothetical protein
MKPALQTQLVTEVLPISEIEFAGHRSQSLAASESEYLPAGHMEQSASPVPGLYVPMAQGLQFKTEDQLDWIHSSAPVKPLLQVHLCIPLLPSGELEFLGQLTHAPAPPKSLYVPASHLEHGPPSGPVEPQSHMQSALVDMPCGDLQIGRGGRV